MLTENIYEDHFPGEGVKRAATNALCVETRRGRVIGYTLTPNHRAGELHPAMDIGQTEAGRSLGLSSLATLRLIVLPQAVKSILPALCNEGIAVLKETAIVGLISVVDLTRASDLVRSRTLSPYFPLLSVAAVYFVLVAGLSALVSRLERKLKESDRS